MSQFERRTVFGETHERTVCPQCGYVVYENPKVVVGSVVAHADKVLMCRRAIEPRRGYWTLPAGYLELGETCEEGAIREAAEEAGACIELDGMLALYSLSRIGHVQIIYRARFAAGLPRFAAGIESLDVCLFGWEAIPWGEIAFPSVHWSLSAWRRVGDGPLGAPIGNPTADPRGTRPLPGGEIL